MNMFRRLVIMAAALSPASVASAQGVPAETPFVDPTTIAVRAAAPQPAVGEQVLDEEGVVDGAFFIENRICTVRGCRVFIFDKRSGALVRNDRVWSDAYALTGRGGQVIRVKAFTPDEYPPTEPPSDAALETAPAIIKVIRITEEKKTP